MAGGYFDTGYQYIFFDPDDHYHKPYTGWNLDHPTNLQGMAQMKHLYDLFQKVEFWNMSPSDNLVTSGTAYCLANTGQEYIIYLPDGGSVTVDLSDATGALNVEWCDPKDGIYHDEGTVTGGGIETFTPPFSGDAVLHIVSTVFNTEPSATDIVKAVLYNSYNSAVNRLFKALESIKERYFYFSNHEITQIFTREQ